jgi:choice-of-anchor C domain-containing protein
VKTLLLAATTAALMAVPAGAVTIINGSFEQSTAATAPGAGGFRTLKNGNTGITGWKVRGTNIDYVGSYWQAQDGSRSIDLNGTGQGAIEQTLTGLSVGQTYEVSFWLAGNPDGGNATKVAVVSDGGAFSDVYDFNTTGHSRQNMGWERQTFRFVADATTARLTFSSAQKGAYGAALDNVGIAAVPEPATWALMILGFGAVGGAMRRRRASAATVRFA